MPPQLSARGTQKESMKELQTQKHITETQRVQVSGARWQKEIAEDRGQTPCLGLWNNRGPECVDWLSMFTFLIELFTLSHSSDGVTVLFRDNDPSIWGINDWICILTLRRHDHIHQAPWYSAMPPDISYIQVAWTKSPFIHYSSIQTWLQIQILLGTGDENMSNNLWPLRSSQSRWATHSYRNVTSTIIQHYTILQECTGGDLKELSDLCLERQWWYSPMG